MAVLGEKQEMVAGKGTQPPTLDYVTGVFGHKWEWKGRLKIA